MTTAFELPRWPVDGALALRGAYRSAPEDFRVTERLEPDAETDGEHVWCEVTKRSLNTTDVAERLARRFGVAPSEVGFCGAKDRHAVTRQWFSVRVPGVTDAAVEAAVGRAGDGTPDPACGARDGDWRIERCLRQRRKLRRGDHSGNDFVLRLRLEEPAAPVAASARTRLAAGVPNYFGPQRFGRGGANLSRAERWVSGRARLPRRGADRGFLLSAARSLLFNEVLAARIADGSEHRVLDGDVLDADGAPTGPLWGRGRSPTAAAAATIEAAALAPWRSWCDALEQVGLQQERRALRVACEALSVRADPEDAQVLELAFTLPPGSFATAVIAALGDFTDARGSAS